MARSIAQLSRRTFDLFAAPVVVIAVLASAVPARAQQPAAPEAGIVVVGEGSISVTPDYARISGGVTTRAKTAKEATDANSKQMSAVIAALLDAGIAQKDIQTSRFSIQPVYAAPQPGVDQKITGYSVSNDVRVTVHDIAKVGDILDRLVAAGATEAGSISFLVSDTSKALDHAREDAVADARRKAEIYARSAGVKLGNVVWITEDSGAAPPMPMGMPRALAAKAVPIAVGEDTLRVEITAGFEIAH